jgi:hypothetical protein
MFCLVEYQSYLLPLELYCFIGQFVMLLLESDYFFMMLRKFMFVVEEIVNLKQMVRAFVHLLSLPLSLFVLLIPLPASLENHRYEDRCQIPSAIFEFFQIASEMWLVCVALDLAVTLSNPFSSFKARFSALT